MSFYTLGYLLCQIRKKKHISQGGMCRGLCTVSMASLIENCKRVPNRKLMEALFSRLGEKAPSNKVIMRKSDFHMRNLEYRLATKISIADFEIKDLLDEYKNLKESLNNLELQLYEFYEALYLNRNSDQNEQSLNELVRALKRTIPDYEIDKPMPNVLISNLEFLILNNIARHLYFISEKTRAVDLMTQLKTYYENANVNTREKAKNLSLIYFNLANWKEMAGERKLALELSEQGKSLCLESNYLLDFPYHIFNIGYCYAQLGEKEKAKSFFSNAFTIFDIMGKHDDTAYATPIINKQFGYDFPTD